MDSILNNWLLAGAGVLGILFYVVKGVLDQVPSVLESWSTVRRAWRRANEDEDEQE
ncbi:hypothetical protein ACFP3U_17765 [Kitasatospora misakiensis]|uniref:Uncharacterized protein n=1 Tax=Kitasatospora misakiensis TaxID=67330 RepID=A0ABW0X8H2_9ACTN